jgi:hypothetical protein
MTSQRSSVRHSLSPVTVWVILCTLLNAAGWLLSAAGRLDVAGYGGVFVLAAPFFVFWYLRARPHFRTGFRIRRFKRAFPLAFAAVAILAVAGGILHAPANYDALAYRTPRVLHWLAEGQWHWIHTDFHRLNTRGAGIEWLTAPLILLTGTDRLFFLINAISFLLLPGLCFRVLTGLGVSKKVAWHWMWILPGGYCYLLQAGSIANDLFGATLALAAVDFALRAARERSAPAAWLAILAAALMTAGKGFNLLLLLPWGLALLPATRALLKRPFATLFVGIIALLISLVPTALLNARYCGDWKGIKAEPVNLATGDPGLHLGVNLALVTLQNVNPTFNPLSGIWNGWVLRVTPDDLRATLSNHFEGGGVPFKLPEMQVEEAAGLGFGISLLMIPVLFGRFRKPGLPSRKWTAVATSPAFLVPAGAWLVTLYFFTQSGLGCPSRYLAPSYVLMLAPLLCLPRAGELLRRRWWRLTAMLGFSLAALLVIATPARPLWPALTLLEFLKAETTSSPWVKRIWTVYSVYGVRADGFAPVRALLPRDLKVLGLVTFDDPETSLWRPFGSHRIVHVTRTDDAKSLGNKGVEYVLVSDYILTGHQNTTLEQWLPRFGGELVSSLDLTLRATRGPTRWHVVRLRPVRPDTGDGAL